MTSWTVVLAACALCLALKVAGYAVPQRLLAGERAGRVASLVTVGLLAALVAVQTLGQGASVVVDARLAALAVAAVALWLRVPFIGVVVLAALTAAGLRAVAA